MRLRGRTGRLPAIAVGLLVAIALTGGGGGAYSYGSGNKGTPAPTGGGGVTAGVTVAIQDFAFSPQTLTVKAGTTVTWTNEDTAPHTVTSTDAASTDAAATGLFDSQLA